MSRVDAAWNHDPRALWTLILDDEQDNNAAELGEIAERLYVNAQEAWAENARLHAQMHSMASQLRARLPGPLPAAPSTSIPLPGSLAP
jgi:hypothetical protein